MKVVIDANVWISAAIRKGPSHLLVGQWMAVADFEVVMCHELLDEIAEVLTTRERLRRWISSGGTRYPVEAADRGWIRGQDR